MRKRTQRGEEREEKKQREERVRGVEANYHHFPGTATLLTEMKSNSHTGCRVHWQS